MQELATEVLDIQNAVNDIRRTLRFKSYEGIRLVPGQPASVEVIVRIREIIDEKIVTISDIEIRNPPENRQVNVEDGNFNVTLRGTRLTLENILDEEIRLHVDLEDLPDISRGEHILPISAEVPDGIELVIVSPQMVTVTVR